MRVVRGHRVVMFLVSIISLFFWGDVVLAAGPTVITSDISVATIWTKENSPYIVSNAITINAPLSLEPGVIVKFNNNAVNNTPATLVVKNDVSVVGTAEEKIVLTSVCDDAYGGDTKSYSTRCNSGPLYLEWGGISLNNTSAHVAIEHTLIFRASRGISYQTNVQNIPYRGLSVKYTEIRQSGSALYLRNTLPTFAFNVLEGNTYGVEVTTGMSDRIPVIRDSSFLNNGVAIKISSPGTTTVDARFNWWGDVTGPYFQSNNPILDNSGGLGDRVIQPSVKFRPWLENVPSDVSLCSDCASNVLFLPGIKGSKLYKDDGSADGDTLWLPSVLSNDAEELGMDENGQSVNTIYTKDILATIPFGSLYESFLEKLDDLKYAGTINDYQSFAYDWRKNVEDILYDGALYPEGVLKSLVTDAEVLARTSKTRKVAIIAHSNGGLLAKALMLELEKRGLENNIETIVFVGAPQMGTPLAVLSLLYGYDEPIPALLSQAKARTLAENMPGAYGLLPSEEYFNRMTDPFITFSSEHTRYKDFQDAYGESIGDYWEGYSFLHGDDGRDKPAANDTEAENVLNGTLVDQARNTHSRLDAWVPPNGVNVIEIAGWGLDTVSGIRYTEKSLAKCYYSGTSVPSCVNEGQYEPVYDPQFTVDGDAVVVAPSALMMSDAGNIKRYWMDLYEINKGLNINRKHRDLLETDSLQVFLSSIITKNTNAALPEFISTARPDDHASAKPRLRMALYSPLDVHLYDTHGNHTGPKKTTVDGQEVTIFEESIPNSYYYQFGERKYVGFPEGEDIRVEMEGYDLGAYTLKLSEVQTTVTGEEETAHATFENLPTTADTLVKFSIPKTGISDMTPLEADVDGNSTKDYSVALVLNGVATLEEESDTTPPTTVTTLAGTNGVGSWYTSDVTVTLVATDNEGGSGVEKTEYSLDNGVTWAVFTEPIVVTSEGTTMLQYFSTDKAGNKEIVKTETIRIDRTAPEGKVVFNSATQKIVVTGTDNLGGAVSVVMLEQPRDMVVSNTKLKHIRPWFEKWWKKNRKNLPDMLATLTDEAGHTTSIAFEKRKDRKGYAFARVKTLAYDESESIPLGASAEFKWRTDRKNQYQQLASYLRVGSETLESRFMPKKNETWIRERTKDHEDDSFEKNEENEVDEHERREWRKLAGLVIPYLETTQGKIEAKY